jgi:serine/threonine protein kinase
MVTPGWVREYQDGQLVPGTPYCVVCLIGTGGMGSVYEVEHVELGRRYVLKSLLRSLATRQDLIARMRNEWRSLGKLRHPNIVDVINAGITEAGVPYFVMEYLEGETVRDRIERRGKLTIGHAVRIAQGTLFGLAAAHAIGVIHRDVKPANVFLTRAGGVKVLDFGIAQTRAEGPKITGRGLAIGTPRYMSPEQAAGEPADARSDVYAVGLLLYEMLAGDGPFDDLSDATQQMLAHLHRPPRPLSQMVDVPRGLDAVVERALAKSPSQRPRSAEYMAAELMPFASVELATTARRISSSPSLTPSTMAISAASGRNSDLARAWQHPTEELRVKDREPSWPTDRRRATSRSRGFFMALAFAGAALAAVMGGVFWARTHGLVALGPAGRSPLTPPATQGPERAEPVWAVPPHQAPPSPHAEAHATSGLLPPFLGSGTTAIPAPTGRSQGTPGALGSARKSPLRRLAPATAAIDPTATPDLDVAHLPPSGL